jgi:uncharacterized membrane protein
MNKNSSQGVSGLTLLGIAFVVLKLTNIINWSWWWVTLPFYGLFGVFLIVLIIWLIVQISRDKPIEQTKQTIKPRSKFQERLEQAIKEQTIKNK